MKITFLGAAKTVTGSCYLVETSNSRFLVDCGMFQGHSKEDELNQEPFPFNPAELDFILLTHAHIDHSGRIPKIYREGFTGTVFATRATVDLCGIMLPDSGHIQEFEAEWTNRKSLRAGKKPVEPLYTYQDALDCMRLFKGVGYGDIIEPSADVRVKFSDAGHILGSSILELWITEDGKEVKTVFSGDLGNKGIPILRDPTPISDADYLVIESTYGNRLHTDNGNKIERFVDIITETIEKGGNIVIPSFAVGRTQEIIYELHKQREKYGEKLRKLFEIPVYVDSPLAISATQVFRKNLDCYDEEARAYVENGDNPLDFPTLKFTVSPDESKELNGIEGSKIIISASGMCEAGRIKHHLKHNLWRKDSTVLFVGYQAEGTLGRRLVNGEKTVKIFGEDIRVNARIESIEGFSGHADKAGLLEWISAFKRKPGKIFIVHGEEQTMNEFAEHIKDSFNIASVIPSRGNSYKIEAGKLASTAEMYDSTAAIHAPTTVRSNLKKLELLELMTRLHSEFDNLSDTLKAELEKAQDDKAMQSMSDKIHSLENYMLQALKK